MGRVVNQFHKCQKPTYEEMFPPAQVIMITKIINKREKEKEKERGLDWISFYLFFF